MARLGKVVWADEAQGGIMHDNLSALQRANLLVCLAVIAAAGAIGITFVMYFYLHPDVWNAILSNQ